MEINPSPKTKASKKFPSYAHAYFVFIYLFILFLLASFLFILALLTVGRFVGLGNVNNFAAKDICKIRHSDYGKIFRPELEGP